jgi:AraC family ethanolamine operon transcriptional activator
MSPGISTRNATIHAAYLSFDNLEELADATSGWEFDWRQLDRGPLKASLLQAEAPSTLVSQFRTSRKFHQRGVSPPGMRTFGIVGVHSSPVEWKGRKWSKNQIEVFPTTDLYEAVSQPGFQGDGVSIPEDRIRSTAETLGLPDPLERLPEGSCFVETDPRRMETLRRSLDSLYSTVSTRGQSTLSELACSEMEFEIHSALVSALASGLDANFQSPPPTVRSRALRLALEYIEASADIAPTVQDICLASGVSYRTLNYAFLDRFGVTPKQYLQAIRLDGVRKDLRKLGPHHAITDAANTWGFWHMGQFAADYRRQFGELPSETCDRVK